MSSIDNVVVFENLLKCILIYLSSTYVNKYGFWNLSNHTPLFKNIMAQVLNETSGRQAFYDFTQLYWVLTVKQREFFRTFVSLLTTLIVSKNCKLRWGCLPKIRLQGFPLLQFPEELETRFLHLLRIFLWFSILFPFPLLMPRLMVEYTLSFILKKAQYTYRGECQNGH